MPTFTHDMHTCFPSGAEEAFGHLRGKPARFLEIGTFEGQTACWMLDHILTHPMATYDGIECHAKRHEITCENLSGYLRHRWGVVQGMSGDRLGLLRQLKAVRFDAIYVDGDHREEACYMDAIHSLHLLLPGGVVLFDDYILKESSTDPDVKFNVEGAVQRAMIDVGPLYVTGMLAKNGYQYIVRKLP